MKQLIKKLLGDQFMTSIRPTVHGLKGSLASMYYGRPANKLKIVGITGTKGKTSTTVTTGRLLNKIGIKTGFISTAVISLDGETEFENPFKMSSLDGVTMHKYLKQMLDNGIEWAVLEMTSQGLVQNRHKGLGEFDITAFLNLFPEHIESHGTFDNYKEAKSKLFEQIKPNGTFIANSEYVHSKYMANAIPDDKLETVNKVWINPQEDIEVTDNGINKNIGYKGKEYETNFYADFEVHNLWSAATIAHHVSGQDLDSILSHSSEVDSIAGRMDFAVQSKNVDILVDYAHEPEGMRKLLENLNDWKTNGHYDNIIHLVSCDGVGRDNWKKPILGDISYKLSDYTVVTTDNYDDNDDPQAIVDIMSQNYEDGAKYAKIIDRREAMEATVAKAKKMKGKTIIVSTGVGNENGIQQPGGKIEWSEKAIWQEVYKANS